MLRLAWLSFASSPAPRFTLKAPLSLGYSKVAYPASVFLMISMSNSIANFRRRAPPIVENLGRVSWAARALARCPIRIRCISDASRPNELVGIVQSRDFPATESSIILAATFCRGAAWDRIAPMRRPPCNAAMLQRKTPRSQIWLRGVLRCSIAALHGGRRIGAMRSHAAPRQNVAANIMDDSVAGKSLL